MFETWIWDRVVAFAMRVAALVNWAAIRAALVRVIDRLPVWVALLMFGIPFVVAETGAAVCVFVAATGHILTGSVGYVIVKVFGFGLVVPIFDLTRHKLLTLRWFAYLYEKMLVFHEFAQRLVAPYRQAARRLVGSWPSAPGRCGRAGRPAPTRRRADRPAWRGRGFLPYSLRRMILPARLSRPGRSP